MLQRRDRLVAAAKFSADCRHHTELVTCSSCHPDVGTLLYFLLYFFLGGGGGGGVCCGGGVVVVVVLLLLNDIAHGITVLASVN